jgi:ketosteroid isomerase-like protein
MKRLACLLALAVLLAAAISGAARAQAPASPPPDPTNELRAFVQGFIYAVNQLNVDELARMYAPGPATTVVRNGTITYGSDAIGMQARRMLNAAVRDSLDASLEDVRVTMLGPNDALIITPVTLGHAQPGEIKRGGTMTFVVEKRVGKWLILHDHTTFNCQAR